jgi:hypothetical protein
LPNSHHKTFLVWFVDANDELSRCGSHISEIVAFQSSFAEEHEARLARSCVEDIITGGRTVGPADTYLTRAV